jgi:hypothetical protein
MWDPIDALAIARAALREPDLSRPRPDERVYEEIKFAGRSPRRLSSLVIRLW